jgi:threonyl-tRNA synthetase
MIHRAPFGSLERFVGILIEHFAGDFPLWLAPEQARILTIADTHAPYAREICARLREKNIRATVDDTGEKIGAKVRRAKLEKIPYLLTVGAKEIETRTLNVESRHKGKEGPLTLDAILTRLQQEITHRTLTSKPTDQPTPN